MEKRLTLGIFEKYIVLWIIACVVIGFLLGRYFPQLGPFLNSKTFYNVSIPMIVSMFFLMYPALAGVKLEEMGKVIRSPKPTILTLTANWVIAPLLTASFAYLVLRGYPEYMAGVILLGIAPCTGMVLYWTALAGGNVAQGIVVTAINAVSTVFLYAPMAALYLGVTGIPVPISLIAFSVFLFLGLPLFVGQFTRWQLIKRRSRDWFEGRFLPLMHNIGAIALLIILVTVFLQEADHSEQPSHGWFNRLADSRTVCCGHLYPSGLAWLAKFNYEDAAMSAFIGSGTQFEIAIASAAVLFGIGSGAALATVVGPLLEVPLMVAFTRIVIKTRTAFHSLIK